jgi:adenylate cyclase, class 2
MARAGSKLETEIKLRLDDRAALKRQLSRLGFSIAMRRALESNTVFDTPGGFLQREGKLLRLRQTGSRGVITYKGPVGRSQYKAREEIESGFTNEAAMRLILERLGFQPVFRYQKYRTEYKRPNQAGSVMLDETPIGDFLELEGSPRWIERTARELGRGPADYITDSYGALYRKHCQVTGEAPGHMVYLRRRL